MTEGKTSFSAQIRSFPSTFWVANTMEIFERMAWYGFFAVSSLYITGPTETGGLGFTSEERGQVQAIVPFFLYLMPVVTGALADRYGYKKMFIIAYTGMVISYYALGQFKEFPSFLGAFMLVAVAAAIFKPVVVGTVARVTTEKNSGLGFGVFYMMVNVGGFLGPLVAGAVRGVSWRYVFIACSGWAFVNLIIVSIFYKDPSTEATSGQRRTLGKVARDMVEVLGNVRFGICVFTILIALMLANQELEWFSWTRCGIFIAVWLVANFLWDALMPAGSGDPDRHASKGRTFLTKRMHCSNWRFALFLLIMSGFWTSFNQIFLTMPEYIRDYTDTRPMVNLGRNFFGMLGKPNWIDRLAAIEETELMAKVDALVRRAHDVPGMVPDEPTETDLKQNRIDALKQIKTLLKKRGELSESDVTALNEAAEKLKQAAKLPPVDMAPVTDDASAVAGRVDRALKIRHLADDRSLDSGKLAALSRLAERINVAGAKRPLEAVDLVEGSRAMLAYKVRIEPTELGELLATIPLTVDEVADAELETAIKTINKRLDDQYEPELTEDEEVDLKADLKALVLARGPMVPLEDVVAVCDRFSAGDRTLKPKVLALGIRDIAYRPTIWPQMDAGRQVNPEHIVNFDALAIVLLQVLVSFMMAKFHQFTTMIVGMVVAALGIGLSAVAGGTMLGPVGGLLIVVVAGIVIFAIGEMMASPTSQEYVGRIAPKERVAVYMGYYFVAVALGNLFGGILSGQLYGKVARDMQRPDIMWLVFGALMLLTAVVFLLYNRLALPHHRSHTMTTKA
jgi:MFS family permease